MAILESNEKRFESDIEASFLSSVGSYCIESVAVPSFG